MNIKSMQKNFRILKDWKIFKGNPKEFTGVCSISPNMKFGEIYPYGQKDAPKDYLVHEMLHFAVRALLRMDRRSKKELMVAEEELVQDICVLIRKGNR